MYPAIRFQQQRCPWQRRPFLDAPRRSISSYRLGASSSSLLPSWLTLQRPLTVHIVDGVLTVVKTMAALLLAPPSPRPRLRPHPWVCPTDTFCWPARHARGSRPSHGLDFLAREVEKSPTHLPFLRVLAALATLHRPLLNPGCAFSSRKPPHPPASLFVHWCLLLHSFLARHGTAPGVFCFDLLLFWLTVKIFRSPIKSFISLVGSEK